MQLNPLILKPKTWLEEKTYQILHDLDIKEPHQIDLESICYHLSINLLYTNTRSYSTIRPSSSGMSQIFIDFTLPEREQREIIVHEIGHILYHSGNQFFMNKEFIQLQESQTERFTGYLLVPFFMFKDIELPELPEQAIYFIAKTFNVTLPLASRKYDQLLSRQFENRYKFIG